MEPDVTPTGRTPAPGRGGSGDESSWARSRAASCGHDRSGRPGDVAGADHVAGEEPVEGRGSARARRVLPRLRRLEVLVERGHRGGDDAPPRRAGRSRRDAQPRRRSTSPCRGDGLGVHVGDHTAAEAVDEVHDPVGDVAEPVGEVLVGAGDQPLRRVVGVGDRGRRRGRTTTAPRRCRSPRRPAAGRRRSRPTWRASARPR